MKCRHRCGTYVDRASAWGNMWVIFCGECNERVDPYTGYANKARAEQAEKEWHRRMAKPKMTVEYAKVCDPPVSRISLNFGGRAKGKDFVERIDFIAVPSNGHPASERYVNINVYRTGEKRNREVYVDSIDDRISLYIDEAKEFYRVLGEVIAHAENGKLCPCEC